MNAMQIFTGAASLLAVSHAGDAMSIVIALVVVVMIPLLIAAGFALAAWASRPAGVQRVVVLLIKPSGYDKDGLPYRYWKGVLPSNTLATLNGLTQQALGTPPLSAMTSEIYALEDGIGADARLMKRLYRRFPEVGTKLIVGLVGVQTWQFPRACDLLRRWKAKGAAARFIGGFHVSGSIKEMFDGIHDATRKDVPCPHQMPAEITEIMADGVSVFYGEAEELWAQALRDALTGTVQPLYRGGMVDLAKAPLPEYPSTYYDHYATRIGTIDAGRGCIFACSFCTIINVQGRTMRHRSLAAVMETTTRMCRRFGRASLFITDDNFARNPLWREIFLGFIELRRQGHEITFMMQVDLACGKIPEFLALAAAAGCTQVFLGVESLDPKNLADARKGQNKVNDYEQLFKRCHDLDITVHASYIIGFPHDTPESVARNVGNLSKIGADQASFFTLTPIPGSEDHARALAAGVPMDPDFNWFNSFERPVMDHPLMTRAEWTEAYRRAWQQFYRPANMIRALKRRGNLRARVLLYKNFLWYPWAINEGAHPMIGGFYRIFDFGDRRPGVTKLSLTRYLSLVARYHLRFIGRFFYTFYVAQHVIYEVECAPKIREKHGELSAKVHGWGDWLRLTFGRGMSRRWLHAFWRQYYARHGWQLLWNPIPHLRALPYSVSEGVYTVRFPLILLKLLRPFVFKRLIW